MSKISSCLHKENYVACTNHACTSPMLPMWKVLKGPDYAVSMYKMVTSNLPAVCGPVYSGKPVHKVVQCQDKTAQPCMQLPLAHWLQL